MKQIFLIITLFSIIAIFSPNAFAQTVGELISKVTETWVGKNYTETIKAVDTLEQKYRSEFILQFRYYRAMSRVKLYINKDVPEDTRLDFKYSAEAKSELAKAAEDFEQIFTELERVEKQQAELGFGSSSINSADIDTAFYTAGVVANRLGKFFYHQPSYFKRSEKYLLKHLESKKPVATASYFLLDSQAGQSKFDETIKTADKMLTNPTYDIGTTVRAVVDGFDTVGDFYQSDAFLLRTAKFLKGQNKPLSLIKTAVLSHRRNQAESLALQNPTTNFELSRKGGMLVLTNKLAEAVPLLEKVLAKDKENITAYRWHLTAITRGTNREAIDNEIKTLTNPVKSGVLESMTIGLVAAGAGDLDAAAKFLTQAVDTYPELAMVYGTFNPLAAVYNAQKNTEKLNATVTKAKEIIALKTELDNALKN